MTQAIWRGNAVKVLSATIKTAIIITPLSIRLQVRAAELQELRRRKVRKPASIKPFL